MNNLCKNAKSDPKCDTATDTQKKICRRLLNNKHIWIYPTRVQGQNWLFQNSYKSTSWNPPRGTNSQNNVHYTHTLGCVTPAQGQ